MPNMRIQQLFSNNKARVAFLTVGDGGIEKTFHSALALIEGGVNMLELGIPFSDPIADGPLIQRASSRALAQGTTMRDVLYLVKSLRQYSDIPLILFSYLNPILCTINTDFFKSAQQAGIDGLLLVDCPLEESLDIRDRCHQHNIDLIYMISSSTTCSRIKHINTYASGFVYYACQTGTTGMRQQLPNNFKTKIKNIKSHVHVPVIVGFGIANLAMAKQVWEEADGVVIGSYFIKLLEENITSSALTRHTRDIYPSP